MFVTLAEVKGQLSIQESNTVHDDRLTRLIGAAEAWATNFLNVDTLEDIVDESPVTSPIELPEDAKSALLMYIECEFDRDQPLYETMYKRAQDTLWPYRQGLEV